MADDLTGWCLFYGDREWQYDFNMSLIETSVGVYVGHTDEIKWLEKGWKTKPLTEEMLSVPEIERAYQIAKWYDNL